MPTAKARPSKPDLKDLMGSEGEENYRQLLKVLRATRGRFAFLPIRSNLPAEIRDCVLDRLDADLRKEDMELRFFHLSAEDWDPLPHLPPSGEDTQRYVYVVLGLERTPEMAAASSKAGEPPPALSQLNRAREALRGRLRCPLVMWCTPLVYDRLREHAPDLFDQFVALPELMTSTGAEVLAAEYPSAEILKHLQRIATRSRVPGPIGMQSMVAFYEECLSREGLTPLDRARFELGLAHSLYALPWGNKSHRLTRAKSCVEQALKVLSPEENGNDWINAKQTLGHILRNLRSGDRTENLEQAVVCYQEALGRVSRSLQPYEWATIQAGLALTYAHWPHDSDGDYQLRAAAAYHEASSYLSQDAELAGLSALMAIVAGFLDHSNDATEVRSSLLIAEELIGRLDGPDAQISARCAIAYIYADLGLSGDSESRARAIEYCESMLRDGASLLGGESRVQIQITLGKLYGQIASTNPEDHLGTAVSHLSVALRGCKELGDVSSMVHVVHALITILQKTQAIDQRVEILNQVLLLLECAEREFEAAGLERLQQGVKELGKVLEGYLAQVAGIRTTSTQPSE